VPPRQIRINANESTKAAPLSIRATSGLSDPVAEQAPANGQVIVVNSPRPLALGALLPLGSARYLLLRGLPTEGALSAGRQTGPGTWMVKDMDVPGLTLTLGQDARGDYPVEVYQLDADSGPQARQRLILRIDNAPQVYAAGFSLSWPAAAPEVPQDPDAAVEADVSREQAQRLLGAGDIAAARRLLTDLAEQGHADAAYELALTYDREVLAKAGLADVDSDAAIARAWYEYAARADHAGATQRLEALAKRRAGA
jgi:hypothetical protein